MKATSVAVATMLVLSMQAIAQTSTSTGTGGAGGTGGSASGGSATGGAAQNTNNISGAGSASGGSGGAGGAGGIAYGGASQGGSSTAQGGSSTAQGGSSGGNTLGADVTVNYNLPTGPVGKDGLGVGVDPGTGHVVTETVFKYDGAQKIKNTPDLGIGGPASGPCNGFSAGIGVAIPGLGIGANMSTVDEGCTYRETARIAAMLGRMDIANALMENLPMVQAAMAAKAARTRADAAPQPAAAAPASQRPADGDEQKRQKELEQQQAAAVQAIQRANTMAQVNDTLKFTNARSQSKEKTPQEVMAEGATRKLAETRTRTPAETKQETDQPVTNWLARGAHPEPVDTKKSDETSPAATSTASGIYRPSALATKSYEDIERERLWTQLRPQSTP